MNHSISFVANTPDDLHCVQAAYRMIVTYFIPDFAMGWGDWSRVTGYEEGMGTWASTGLLWFKRNGFEVRHVSLFDYERFVKEGGAYLMDTYGSEAGAWQVTHSRLPFEQAQAADLLASGSVEQREPTQSDIKRLLDEGYLVRCLVNSCTLNQQEGYVGHAIVVSGYEDDGFIVQDPGLPPLKDRKVSYEKFEKAWADPNKEAKELDAIRLDQ